MPAARTHDHVASGHRGGYDEQQINSACDAIGWTDTIGRDQQKVINAQFGGRAHRLQLALWHSVRGGLNASASDQVIQAFGQPWGVAHPLCPAPENNPTAPDYNPVGEDFLYMHQQNLLGLKAAFTAVGVKCVRAWDHIPTPEEWPIPDRVDIGAKSDRALGRLQDWDQFLTSATWLRSISLSQLGWALEFTIHNTLQLRFASARPDKPFQSQSAKPDGAPLPLTGKFPARWVYDNPAYNWLADPYAAALNPTFWKINGYIGRAVKLWLAANGKKRISEDCRGATDCYEWRGVWVGSLPALRAQTTKQDESDAEFNRWRMALQRIGVLPLPDLSAPAASPLADATTAIHCH